VYTQDVDGFIYSDGVITNLIKDGSGNCVESGIACYPDPLPANYNQACGCNDAGLFNCTGDCIDQTTGLAIDAICADITLSCSADQSPSVLENGTTDVTFNASGSPSGLTYTWYQGANASNEIAECSGNSSCDRTYTTPGLKTIYVRYTHPNTQYEESQCSVTVTSGDQNQQNKVCIDNKWFDRSTGTEGETIYVPSTDLSLCGEPNVLGPLDVVEYDLIPSIVAELTDMCELNLQVEDTTSCRLFDKNDQIYHTFTPDGMGVINTTLDVEVGSYNLGCSGISNSTVAYSKLYGTRKCILNPKVSEF
jgi:hypothetical protein